MKCFKFNPDPCIKKYKSEKYTIAKNIAYNLVDEHKCYGCLALGHESKATPKHEALQWYCGLDGKNLTKFYPNRPSSCLLTEVENVPNSKS